MVCFPRSLPTCLLLPPQTTIMQPTYPCVNLTSSTRWMLELYQWVGCFNPAAPAAVKKESQVGMRRVGGGGGGALYRLTSREDTTWGGHCYHRYRLLPPQLRPLLLIGLQTSYSPPARWKVLSQTQKSCVQSLLARRFLGVFSRQKNDPLPQRCNVTQAVLRCCCCCCCCCC